MNGITLNFDCKLIVTNFAALDYTPGPYYAMFNVNGTNATFSINITNDMEVEGNETFHVFITNVTDYNYNMEFLPNNVTVTIDDDDDNNCKQLCTLTVFEKWLNFILKIISS